MKGGKEGWGKEGWVDGWVDMHLRMRARRSGPITLGDGRQIIREFTVRNGEDDISSF